MTSKEDFHRWREDAGFNGKQIAIAGETIGLAFDRAMRLSTGKLELSATERLAMSAVLAGLKPWTPELSAELKEIPALRQQLETIGNQIVELAERVEAMQEAAE